MSHIEQFLIENFEIEKKTLFISTDDINIIKEAKKNYNNYNIFHNEKKNIDLAVNYSHGYTYEAFQGLLVDLTILSEAEFVVCTLSSNVCRLVYELMQSQDNNIDAFYRLKSLDNQFHLDTFNTIIKKAKLDHNNQSKQEIQLKNGDLIEMFEFEDRSNRFANDLGNGFMKGKNLRTNLSGLFPSFKVVNYFTNEI